MRLRRHGDVARIANAFQSSVKQLAGGRVYHFFEPNPQPGDSAEKRAENYRQFLLDALVTWHESKDSRNWTNGELQTHWTKYIEPLLGGTTLVAEAQDETRTDKKRRLKGIEELLKDIAGRLADDAKLRAKLAPEFTKIWEGEEAQWRGKNGHLRWLRGLILPRIGPKPDGGSPEFKAWKDKLRALRNVGGLSIDRLATILMLYQVLRAFHSRPEPSNLPRRNRAHRDRGGQRASIRTTDSRRVGATAAESYQAIGQSAGRSRVRRWQRNPHKHWEGNRKTNRRDGGLTNRNSHRVNIVAEYLENYRPNNRGCAARSTAPRLGARNVRKYIMEGANLTVAIR